MKIEFTLPIYHATTKRKIALMSLNWFRNAYFRIINNIKQDYHKMVFSQLIKDNKKRI